jgi:hypothetical protein
MNVINDIHPSKAEGKTRNDKLRIMEVYHLGTITKNRSNQPDIAENGTSDSTGRWIANITNTDLAILLVTLAIGDVQRYRTYTSKGQRLALPDEYPDIVTRMHRCQVRNTH